jgi:predicted regulator of Ras-like GTPase activity (Roadblock/LC7/MglB family)
MLKVKISTLLAARLRYDYTWKLLPRADFRVHNGDSVVVYRSESLAKTRTEQLVARLRDLQASSGDVEAAAIVSVDGLSIASSLPVGTEEDRVSAMSAAMLSLGERITSELGRGLLQQVLVKGENGYVILTSVGEEAVLTVIARKEAKLGLIFLDIARTVQDLEKLL